MSAPVSDDENSNHQMYAPKSLRERTSIPRAQQLRVDLPRISPSRLVSRSARGIRVSVLGRRFGK